MRTFAEFREDLNENGRFGGFDGGNNQQQPGDMSQTPQSPMGQPQVQELAGREGQLFVKDKMRGFSHEALVEFVVQFWVESNPERQFQFYKYLYNKK